MCVCFQIAFGVKGVFDLYSFIYSFDSTTVSHSEVHHYRVTSVRLNRLLQAHKTKIDMTLHGSKGYLPECVIHCRCEYGQNDEYVA